MKILQVEEVGDQEAIDEILQEKSKPRTYAEIRKLAEETKIRANDYFSKNSINDAVKLYLRIVQTIQLAKTADETEEKDKKDILVCVMANLAICKNKQEDWKEALEFVKMIEDIRSIETQPKVLFAKGRALMKLGDIEEALVFLVKALKLRSDDKQILKAIEECQKRKVEYNSFNKDFAKNLKLA